MADHKDDPLRGACHTLKCRYTGRPWTIRQYAGFSTAEESNAFYRVRRRGRAQFFFAVMTAFAVTLLPSKRTLYCSLKAGEHTFKHLMYCRRILLLVSRASALLLISLLIGAMTAIILE